MIKTFYLIRHGETIWNAQQRYQGQLNSDLTPRGQQQARAVGQLLNKLLSTAHAQEPLALYHSPLGRAVQTTQIIQQQLQRTHQQANNMPIIASPLLKECHYGEWQGRTKPEVMHTCADAVAARNANKWHYKVPTGESYAELSQRAASFIHSLTSNNTSSPTTVLIVAHEMLNRTLRGVLLDLPPDKIMDVKQANNQIIRIHAGEERYFVASNHK